MLPLAAILIIVAVELAHVLVSPTQIMLVGMAREARPAVGIVARAAEPALLASTAIVPLEAAIAVLGAEAFLVALAEAVAVLKHEALLAFLFAFVAFVILAKIAVPCHLKLSLA